MKFLYRNALMMAACVAACVAVQTRAAPAISILDPVAGIDDSMTRNSIRLRRIWMRIRCSDCCNKAPKPITCASHVARRMTRS